MTYPLAKVGFLSYKSKNCIIHFLIHIKKTYVIKLKIIYYNHNVMNITMMALYQIYISTHPCKFHDVLTTFECAKII